MKKIIILIIAGLFVAGCGKDFLDRKPLSDLTVSNFYKTSSDAKEAILAVYSVLQGQRFYGTSYMEVTEYPSDDASTKLATEPLDDFNWSSAKGLGGEPKFKDIWVEIYEGVYRSNLVLQNVPGISMKEEDKKIILAEAQLLRGVFYWHLATLFGNGPVFIKPAEKIDDVIAKANTRNEIFEQAIKDMEEALPNLPEAWDATNTGRLTKTAGQAFLGKAYLYYACHNKANSAVLFTKSANNLRAVVNSGRYQLLPSFSKVFTEDNENNKESVFEIQYKNRGAIYLGWYSDGGNANEGSQRDLRFGIQNQTSQYGFGEIIATQNWANSLEIGDPRIRLTVIFVWDSTLNGYEAGTNDKYNKTVVYQPSWGRQIKAASNILGEYYHVKKAVSGYVGSGGALNSGNNWRMIRYADVLLMLAEAIGETEGVTSEAVGYLNQVRQRAKGTLGYGISNSIDVTNPSFVETVAGSSFLNDFPYVATNTDILDPFTGEINVIDLSDGSKLSFQKAIVLERRAELAFEYHRFLDMVRWQAYDENHPGAANQVFAKKLLNTDKKLYIKDKHKLFPIPQTEIDLAKGKIEQNPQY